MIPGLDNLLSPDLQKILLFAVPTLVGLGSFTMNLSRGFTIAGTTFTLVCWLVALYFLPDFLKVF